MSQGMVKLQILVLLVAPIAACGRRLDRETVRVTSPDGRMDAVVFELTYVGVDRRPDAYASRQYVVHLVRKGEEIVLPGPEDDGTPTPDVAFTYPDSAISPRCEGLNVRWEGPRRLIVECQTPRCVKIKRAETTIEGRLVTLRLVEPIDPSVGREQD